jgi:hypothetical protein
MTVEMYKPTAIAAALLALALANACTAEGEITDTEAMAIANPDGTVVCHKGNEIAIAFAAIDNHLSHGDFLGPCAATAAAAGSILVCHKPDNHGGHEIAIAFPAIDNHLSHGDFLGPCEPPPE